jgi:hypothetical protein
LDINSRLHTWLCGISSTDTTYLNLSFTVPFHLSNKRVKMDVVRLGAHLRVDELNKHDFTQAASQLVLQTLIGEQLDAIATEFVQTTERSGTPISHTPTGLRNCLKGPTASPYELWMFRTSYKGCSSVSPPVAMFWDVVGELPDQERMQLFEYVAGHQSIEFDAPPDDVKAGTVRDSQTSLPSLTIKLLSPKKTYALERKRNGNIIELPAYKTKGRMRRMVNEAVERWNYELHFQ